MESAWQSKGIRLSIQIEMNDFFVLPSLRFFAPFSFLIDVILPFSSWADASLPKDEAIFV